MPNRRSRPLIAAAGLLAVTWAAVLGTRAWLATQEVTAASLVAHLDAHPLDAAGVDRAAYLRDLADRTNRLAGSERMDPVLGERFRDLFQEMTDAERRAHLAATVPRGFEQMMVALNAMEPDARRALVQEAQQRMAGPDGRPPPGVDDEMVQQIVDEGMKQYLSTADAQTKLDLQPLVVQLQQNLRRMP